MNNIRDVLYRGVLNGLTAVLTLIFVGYMIGIVRACHQGAATQTFVRTELR